VTVRNTGTAASSGQTTVLLQAAATGYFRDSTGTGWTCADTGDRVRTCTNQASIPAGGSLPPLTFPWASLGGYGYAPADVTLTNATDGTIDNNTTSIHTPVVDPVTLDDAAAVPTNGRPSSSSHRTRSLQPSEALAQDLGVSASQREQRLQAAARRDLDWVSTVRGRLSAVVSMGPSHRAARPRSGASQNRTLASLSSRSFTSGST